MTVTIVDVAREAGVSKSTASRALTSGQSVSAAARERVRAAAARLGYQVNRAAQTLRGGSSRQIGLVITNLTNASFQRITTVMHSLAYAAGYQVMLCITDGDAEHESKSLAALRGHDIEGLVVVSTDAGVEEVNRLHSGGLPVVALVRDPAGLQVPRVVGGDREGAHEVTQYLLSAGHRRIAYIGGTLEMSTGRARFNGYSSAHREAQVPVGEGLVKLGEFTPAFGRAAIGELLSEAGGFTALLVANHEAVFGALPELVGRGIRIPEDLSLACYEDVPLFEVWNPSITVVDNKPEQMAHKAFDLLLAQMSGRPVEPHRYVVKPRLVRRGSTREIAPREVSDASEAAAERVLST